MFHHFPWGHWSKRTSGHWNLRPAETTCRSGLNKNNINTYYLLCFLFNKNVRPSFLPSFLPSLPPSFLPSFILLMHTSLSSYIDVFDVSPFSMSLLDGYIWIERLQHGNQLATSEQASLLQGGFQHVLIHWEFLLLAGCSHFMILKSLLMVIS